MAAEWFVRCRGLEPEQDYVWLDEWGNKMPWVEPPTELADLDARVTSGGGLILSLGFNQKGRAFAFVDGLESEAMPRDFVNRRISVGVLALAYTPSRLFLAALVRQAATPERDALLANIVQMRTESPEGWTVVPSALEHLFAAARPQSDDADAEMMQTRGWGPPDKLAPYLDDACRKLLHDDVTPSEVLFVSSDILTTEWCRENNPFRAVSPLIPEPVDDSTVPAGEEDPKPYRLQLMMVLGALVMLVALIAAVLL